MCLTNPTTTEPLIAKEDILVYKNLAKSRSGLLSPIWMYPYVLNRVMKSKLMMVQGNIEQGLHCYKRPRAMIFLSEIYEAIIPKGSKYYENDKEIASDTLIVKRPLQSN